METEHIKEAIQSPAFKKAISICAIAAGVFVIFAVGMEVGYMKAGFSYKFGESYYRSFGQDGAHPMGFVPGDVSDAHGVSGKVLSVSLPTLVIAGRDNTEKIVRINDDTVIRSERSTIKAGDLKSGQMIVIIGDPNDSAEIDAKLIRVLGMPPESQAAKIEAPEAAQPQ